MRHSLIRPPVIRSRWAAKLWSDLAPRSERTSTMTSTWSPSTTTGGWVNSTLKLAPGRSIASIMPR
jgi:hypothetical protein